MKRLALVLDSLFMGAGIVPLGLAIGKWGKISVQERILLVGISVLFFTLSLVIEKYKLHQARDVNRDGQNKFFRRYPILLKGIAMAIGTFVGSVCYAMLVGE